MVSQGLRWLERQRAGCGGEEGQSVGLLSQAEIAQAGAQAVVDVKALEAALD